MVAYSFAREFCDRVASGAKTQTVRTDRKRHARPGEPVQLYFGMRTRSCRKLVEPDPICAAVRPISIVLDGRLRELIASIAIDGRDLDASEIEAFARADGFGPHWGGEVQFPRPGDKALTPGPARYWMGWWWLRVHGDCRFNGVVISWKPAS